MVRSILNGFSSQDYVPISNTNLVLATQGLQLLSTNVFSLPHPSISFNIYTNSLILFLCPQASAIAASVSRTYCSSSSFSKPVLNSIASSLMLASFLIFLDHIKLELISYGLPLLSPSSRRKSAINVDSARISDSLDCSSRFSIQFSSLSRLSFIRLTSYI